MTEGSASSTLEMMVLSWDATASVLVVDDNPADYELVRELALEAGPDLFEFEHAATYAAGLAAMLERRHDLYLVDHHLGRHHGVDLIREATVGGCDGPKIMFTGTGHPEDVEGRAILAGAVDFLSKDRMEPKPLVRLLRNTLARHRAFRTQREEIERLLQSDTSLRIVVQNADGLAVVDSEGLVRFLNPAAEEILGRRLAELAGSVLDLPAAGEEREQRFRRPSGEVRLVAVRSTGLLWEGEECRLASLRDVTSERAAADQLMHAQKMAVVGRLAGGVAHDFNNLLMGILGSIELARDVTLGERDRDRHLREAAATATRAAELTGRLLRTARLDRTEPAVIDLGAVVAEGGSVLSSLVGDAVTLTLPRDTGFWIEGDRLGLEQVLLNLVSNARDATGGRGHVDVRLRHDGRDVVLEVDDDGPGIPKDVLDHIFEPFFTTKEEGAGTGLGLSIVYRVVEAGGGSVDVHTGPRGTRFELRFPGVPGPTDSQLADALIDPAPGAMEGTVLVVDDEPIVLNVVSTILQRAGLTVVRAADGTAAAGLVTEGLRPDLLLSDMSMPGMDGVELSELVREISPQTRILFSTGFEQLPDGSVLPGPVLHKPYRTAELLEAVRKALAEPPV